MNNRGIKITNVDDNIETYTEIVVDSTLLNEKYQEKLMMIKDTNARELLMVAPGNWTYTSEMINIISTIIETTPGIINVKTKYKVGIDKNDDSKSLFSRIFHTLKIKK